MDQMSWKRSRVSAAIVVVIASVLGCSKEQPSSTNVQTSVAAEPASEPTVTPTDRVEGEAFLLEWKAGSGSAGDATKGQLVLTPKAPFKCNLEYPYKLKVSAQNVALVKPEITKPEIAVDAKQVVIPVEYTMPSEAQEIDGHLAFSVCTDDKCLIERTQLKLTARAR